MVAAAYGENIPRHEVSGETEMAAHPRWGDAWEPAAREAGVYEAEHV
jgi:hypothetical protein